MKVFEVYNPPKASDPQPPVTTLQFTEMVEGRTQSNVQSGGFYLNTSGKPEIHNMVVATNGTMPSKANFILTVTKDGGGFICDKIQPPPGSDNTIWTITFIVPPDESYSATFNSIFFVSDHIIWR